MNSEYRTIRFPLVFGLLAFPLLVTMVASCSVRDPTGDVARQKMIVTAAEATVVEESERLATMRDGMASSIREARKLGMEAWTADSVLHEVLRGQESVVEAARENLTRQKAYLDLLEAAQ